MSSTNASVQPESEQRTMLSRALSGLVRGMVYGLLVGGYVFAFTNEWFIRADDYVHPGIYDEVGYEAARLRFGFVVAISAVAFFGLARVVIAAIWQSGWPYHADYGMLGSVVLVVATGLITAAFLNQYPFNNLKTSESNVMDAVDWYAVPAAMIFGPFVGIAIGRMVGKER